MPSSSVPPPSVAAAVLGLLMVMLIIDAAAGQDFGGSPPLGELTPSPVDASAAPPTAPPPAEPSTPAGSQPVGAPPPTGPPLAPITPAPTTAAPPTTTAAPTTTATPTTTTATSTFPPTTVTSPPSTTVMPPPTTTMMTTTTTTTAATTLSPPTPTTTWTATTATPPPTTTVVVTDIPVTATTPAAQTTPVPTAAPATTPVPTTFPIEAWWDAQVSGADDVAACGSAALAYQCDARRCRWLPEQGCVDRCPDGFSVCIRTGLCSMASADNCAVGTACPAGTTPCWDSTCAASSERCPCPDYSAQRCDVGTWAVRGVCIEPSRLCPTATSNSSCNATAVLCWDGACAASAAVCACPPTRPTRCPNGTNAADACVASPFECDVACPAELPVRCTDGNCAATAAACTCDTNRVAGWGAAQVSAGCRGQLSPAAAIQFSSGGIFAGERNIITVASLAEAAVPALTPMSWELFRVNTSAPDSASRYRVIALPSSSGSPLAVPSGVLGPSQLYLVRVHIGSLRRTVQAAFATSSEMRPSVRVTFAETSRDVSAAGFTVEASAVSTDGSALQVLNWQWRCCGDAVIDIEAAAPDAGAALQLPCPTPCPAELDQIFAGASSSRVQVSPSHTLSLSGPLFVVAVAATAVGDFDTGGAGASQTTLRTVAASMPTVSLTLPSTVDWMGRKIDFKAVTSPSTGVWVEWRFNASEVRFGTEVSLPWSEPWSNATAITVWARVCAFGSASCGVATAVLEPASLSPLNVSNVTCSGSLDATTGFVSVALDAAAGAPTESHAFAFGVRRRLGHSGISIRAPLSPLWEPVPWARGTHLFANTTSADVFDIVVDVAFRGRLVAALVGCGSIEIGLDSGTTTEERGAVDIAAAALALALDERQSCEALVFQCAVASLASSGNGSSTSLPQLLALLHRVAILCPITGDAPAFTAPPPTLLAVLIESVTQIANVSSWGEDSTKLDATVAWIVDLWIVAVPAVEVPRSTALTAQWDDLAAALAGYSLAPGTVAKLLLLVSDDSQDGSVASARTEVAADSIGNATVAVASANVTFGPSLATVLGFQFVTSETVTVIAAVTPVASGTTQGWPNGTVAVTNFTGITLFAQSGRELRVAGLGLGDRVRIDMALTAPDVLEVSSVRLQCVFLNVTNGLLSSVGLETVSPIDASSRNGSVTCLSSHLTAFAVVAVPIPATPAPTTAAASDTSTPSTPITLTAPSGETTVAPSTSFIDYFPTTATPVPTAAATDVATSASLETTVPLLPTSTATAAPSAPTTTGIAAATPAPGQLRLADETSDDPPIFVIVIVACACMFAVAVVVVCCRVRWAKKRREAKAAAAAAEVEADGHAQGSAHGDDETVAFDNNGSFDVTPGMLSLTNGTDQGSVRSGPIARRKSGRRFLPPKSTKPMSDGDPLASTASELPIARTASERSWMDLPMPASQAESAPWRMHPPPPPSSRTAGSSAEDEFGALHVFSDVPSSQLHAGSDGLLSAPELVFEPPPSAPVAAPQSSDATPFASSLMVTPQAFLSPQGHTTLSPNRPSVRVPPSGSPLLYTPMSTYADANPSNLVLDPDGIWGEPALADQLPPVQVVDLPPAVRAAEDNGGLASPRDVKVSFDFGDDTDDA